MEFYFVIFIQKGTSEVRDVHWYVLEGWTSEWGQEPVSLKFLRQTIEGTEL